MASMLKVGAGVYRVRWCLGRDPRGKQLTRSRTVRGTRRDAQRVKREVERAIELGQARPASDLTVEGYLRQWLDDEVAATKAPRTQIDYQSIVEGHLIPALGSIKLQRLTPQHVQQVRRELLECGGRDRRPLSKRRVQYVLAVLRKALNDAVALGLIDHNVATRVQSPRPERRPLEAMPLARMQAILDAIRGGPVQAPVQFIARTGVRRGEAMALRWSDVDLEAGLATIRRSMQRLNGQGIVTTPTKRHRSDRTIPLDGATVELLRRHRAQQAQDRLEFQSAYQDAGLIFCWQDGRARDPNTVLKEYQRTVRRAGLGHATVQELRHAHASLLVAQGAHAKLVQERLGHATVNITLDTYAHLLPGQQREAAERFSAALDDVSWPAVDAELTREATKGAEKSP